VKPAIRGRWAHFLGEDFAQHILADETDYLVSVLKSESFHEEDRRDGIAHYLLKAHVLLRSQMGRRREVVSSALRAYAKLGVAPPEGILHLAAATVVDFDEKAARTEERDTRASLRDFTRVYAVVVLIYGPPRRRARALRLLKESEIDLTWANVYEIAADLLGDLHGSHTKDSVRNSYLHYASGVRKGSHFGVLAPDMLAGYIPDIDA
jgi:hypothetical protein